MIERYWTHQAKARRCPITWPLGINVLRIQARGTVITVRSVWQRLDRDAAVFTGEGFLTGNENHETEWTVDSTSVDSEMRFYCPLYTAVLSTSSNVELEVHHVSILNDIIFSFLTHLSRFFGFLF
jgi:hypothetical protein